MTRSCPLELDTCAAIRNTRTARTPCLALCARGALGGRKCPKSQIGGNDG